MDTGLQVGHAVQVGAETTDQSGRYTGHSPTGLEAVILTRRRMEALDSMSCSKL